MEKKLQRAILINVIPPEKSKAEALGEFEELKRLVETYGGIVILKIIQKRGRPSAKTFLGEGKAHEVAQLVKDMKIDVVVINGFLKANQSNHLINIIPCEVLDRFEMILKIFQKHAMSPEAKLQLQIAQHKYEFPKLFGTGAILSQQAAGVGVATSSSAGGRRASRGPGEKILEVKRRHLRNQIQMLEKKLTQFRHIRGFQRQRRLKEEFRTVALVGYTNSGKSSLLRALTKKQNVLVEDKLFSTLDTRLGELYLPDRPLKASGKILLADTIGFIQNLPPLLFSSFLATLEEVKEAELLLHVVDVSDPQLFEKIKIVEDILVQLECENTPRLIVFNKIDMTTQENMNYLSHVFQNIPHAFVSATHRAGFPELLELIEEEMKIKEPKLA